VKHAIGGGATSAFAQRAGGESPDAVAMRSVLTAHANASRHIGRGLDALGTTETEATVALIG
jgi:hypothetical protein